MHSFEDFQNSEEGFCLGVVTANPVRSGSLVLEAGKALQSIVERRETGRRGDGAAYGCGGFPRGGR